MYIFVNCFYCKCRDNREDVKTVINSFGYEENLSFSGA